MAVQRPDIPGFMFALHRRADCTDPHLHPRQNAAWLLALAPGLALHFAFILPGIAAGQLIAEGFDCAYLDLRFAWFLDGLSTTSRC